MPVNYGEATPKSDDRLGLSLIFGWFCPGKLSDIATSSWRLARWFLVQQFPRRVTQRVLAADAANSPALAVGRDRCREKEGAHSQVNAGTSLGSRLRPRPATLRDPFRGTGVANPAAISDGRLRRPRS